MKTKKWHNYYDQVLLHWPGCGLLQNSILWAQQLAVSRFWSLPVLHLWSLHSLFPVGPNFPTPSRAAAQGGPRLSWECLKGFWMGNSGWLLCFPPVRGLAGFCCHQGDERAQGEAELSPNQAGFGSGRWKQIPGKQGSLCCTCRGTKLEKDGEKKFSLVTLCSLWLDLAGFGRNWLDLAGIGGYSPW